MARLWRKSSDAMYEDIVYSDKGNTYDILNQLKNKFVEISYVGADGKQTRKNTYFICAIDKEAVFIKKTAWNYVLSKLEPMGGQFPIPLENVRTVGNGDQIHVFKKRKRR